MLRLLLMVQLIMDC